MALNNVSAEPSDAAPVSVFINYRREEAAGWARALYERLTAKFGRDNVFLDQESLQPGERWAEGIHSGSSSCTALIVLIGPKWAKTLTDRAQEKGRKDYVRREIEIALESDSQVPEVIPTLIEGAKIPEEDDLFYAGSLKPLLKRQQIELNPSSSWDADVEKLVEKLKRLGAEEVAPAPSEVSAPPEPSAPRPESPPPEPPAPDPSSVSAERPTGSPVVPPPGPEHYDELVKWMFEEDLGVVPFLGPGVNSCGRRERWLNPDSASLPDTKELAEYLIERFGMKGMDANLPLVSQGLSVEDRSRSLFNTLERVLPTPRSPGPVHRFLAGLPRLLRRCGAPAPCQLIVTANYDTALEQAFEDAEEGFDLAVYVKDDSEFVHIPNGEQPRPANPPNEYNKFPINNYGRVERTVIMKVHGAVDRPQGPHPWEDNYVITEDDYIGYMSKGDINSIVPMQLLKQLRKYSHFLFLGHEMHDWSLRVFLLRVFRESGQETASWAIQRDPDELDERFWRNMKAELFGIPLDEYVKELGEHLTQVASSRQPQA